MLDKITARVSTREVKVGEPFSFGTLQVVVRACKKAPPIDTPESAGLLSIHEKKPDDPAVKDLFEGWMFASSPALSALEHPVYDVWVVDCKNASKAEAGSSAGNAASRSSAPSSNAR
jgi:hypothetical protein